MKQIYLGIVADPKVHQIGFGMIDISGQRVFSTVFDLEPTPFDDVVNMAKTRTFSTDIGAVQNTLVTQIDRPKSTNVVVEQPAEAMVQNHVLLKLLLFLTSQDYCTFAYSEHADGKITVQPSSDNGYVLCVPPHFAFAYAHHLLKTKPTLQQAAIAAAIVAANESIYSYAQSNVPSIDELINSISTVAKEGGERCGAFTLFPQDSMRADDPQQALDIYQKSYENYSDYGLDAAHHIALLETCNEWGINLRQKVYKNGLLSGSTTLEVKQPDWAWIMEVLNQPQPRREGKKLSSGYGTDTTSYRANYGMVTKPPEAAKASTFTSPFSQSKSPDAYTNIPEQAIPRWPLGIAILNAIGAGSGYAVMRLWQRWLIGISAIVVILLILNSEVQRAFFTRQYPNGAAGPLFLLGILLIGMGWDGYRQAKRVAAARSIRAPVVILDPKEVTLRNRKRFSGVLVAIVLVEVIGLLFFRGQAAILKAAGDNAYLNYDCAIALPNYWNLTRNYLLSLVPDNATEPRINECELLSKAEQYSNQGRFEDAIKSYKDYGLSFNYFASQVHEKLASSYRAFGESMVAKNTPETAITQFQTLMSDYADTEAAQGAENLLAEAQLAYGQALARGGQPADAMRLYQTVSRTNAEYTSQVNSLIQEMFDGAATLSNRCEAVNVYNVFIDENESYAFDANRALPKALYDCGRFHQENKNYSVALQDLNQILTDFPFSIVVEDAQAAIDEINQALALESGNDALSQISPIGTSSSRNVELIIVNASTERLRITLQDTLGNNIASQTVEACLTCSRTSLATSSCPENAPSAQIDVIAGKFTVTVASTDIVSRVRPFYGTWVLQSGLQYAECFYISSSPF